MFQESKPRPFPAEVLTPPPRVIKRPQGLEEELLAAIRRKISTKTTSTKNTRLDSSERKPVDSRPSHKKPRFRYDYYQNIFYLFQWTVVNISQSKEKI